MFKKIVPYIIVCCLVISTIFSVSAFIISVKNSKRVDSMKMELFSVSLEFEKFSNNLSEIKEEVDFIKSWCASAPSVTLGNTYINSDKKPSN